MAGMEIRYREFAGGKTDRLSRVFAAMRSDLGQVVLDAPLSTNLRPEICESDSLKAWRSV